MVKFMNAQFHTLAPNCTYVSKSAVKRAEAEVTEYCDCRDRGFSDGPFAILDGKKPCAFTELPGKDKTIDLHVPEHTFSNEPTTASAEPEPTETAGPLARLVIVQSWRHDDSNGGQGIMGLAFDATDTEPDLKLMCGSGNINDFVHDKPAEDTLEDEWTQDGWDFSDDWTNCVFTQVNAGPSVKCDGMPDGVSWSCEHKDWKDTGDCPVNSKTTITPSLYADCLASKS